VNRYASTSRLENRRFNPLRATVLGGEVALADKFQVKRAATAAVVVAS
jgi:hypothetical protein